jgi:Fe-S-cluster containining protein
MSMDQEPWYREGLRFECTACGNCCTGAPGYVWVNQEEIAALAAAIGDSEETFADKYVRNVCARKSLREFPGGNCVFFDSDTRKCQVYAIRPRQCRSWPFWDSNLRTPEDWQRTRESCPGSGRGRVYQRVEVEQLRRAIRM